MTPRAEGLTSTRVNLGIYLGMSVEIVEEKRTKMTVSHIRRVIFLIIAKLFIIFTHHNLLLYYQPLNNDV